MHVFFIKFRKVLKKYLIKIFNNASRASRELINVFCNSFKHLEITEIFAGYVCLMRFSFRKNQLVGVTKLTRFETQDRIL